VMWPVLSYPATQVAEPASQAKNPAA
jgi:hypothetical protein